MVLEKLDSNMQKNKIVPSPPILLNKSNQCTKYLNVKHERRQLFQESEQYGSASNTFAAKPDSLRYIPM